MIEKLLSIASEIENNYNQKDFSKVSFEKLESIDFQSDLNSLESQITDLILKNKLPKQVNLYNLFGQPPITIFNNGEFVVDIYFWQDNDTSIHDHSFSGAFKLFSGHSIHETFKVSRVDHDFKDIYLSELDLADAQLLSSNNTYEIISGDQFIHRLVHLSNPTVTVCLRTINDNEENQWQYFSSGVSIQKNNITETELKYLFFMEYQFNQNRNNIQSKVMQFTQDLSFSKLFNFYEKLHLYSFGFSEDFNQLAIEIVESIIQSNKYFEPYSNYYILAQDFIECIHDTPEDRLITHCLNNKLDQKLSEKLFKQISSNDFNEYLLKYQ
ncbi:hypothetical protein N9N67_02825 [Bacteriovoracaceae bacterium]|nr:hypothetical protein [Bacteriovoracaceae bacterium]